MYILDIYTYSIIHTFVHCIHIYTCISHTIYRVYVQRDDVDLAFVLSLSVYMYIHKYIQYICIHVYVHTGDIRHKYIYIYICVYNTGTYIYIYVCKPIRGRSPHASPTRAQGKTRDARR